MTLFFYFSIGFTLPPPFQNFHLFSYTLEIVVTVEGSFVFCSFQLTSYKTKFPLC